MESDGDDIENIFEEYENNGNDAEIENTENNTANETPGAVKIAAPKRIIRNPRLKFNADRLCGERGIPVLVDHFKNVKFKGLGHEKEDLDKLLSKLEHWTHRLFPSMKFEDCLTHIEKLGKKRQVQTCLRKMRLGMPILNSDFTKDNKDDDVKRNEDVVTEEISDFDRLLGQSQEASSIDISDRLLGQSQEASSIDVSDRLLGQSQEASSIDVSALENISNSNFFHSSPMSNDTSGHVLGSSFGSNLTAEQKERMERNKMLAAERRQARLAAMEQKTVESQSENNKTTLSDNPNEQNSFDKLLGPSESNEENLERNQFGLGSSHDFDENLNKSSDFNNDNSEKLGLDDLMNLVDDEDSVSNENMVASGSASDTNKCPPHNAQNLNSFSSTSESNVLSSSETLNVKSSLNLISESSVDPNTNVNTDGSMKNTLVGDENSVTEHKDLNSMDCEDENSHDDGDNCE